MEIWNTLTRALILTLALTLCGCADIKYFIDEMEVSSTLNNDGLASGVAGMLGR